MILNTKYIATKLVTEEVDLLNNKTTFISSINKTMVSEIARQLADNSKDAIKLARMIRYRINQGLSLNEAIKTAVTEGV